MSREIMQQALSAFEEIMFTKNVGSSHIIAKNARYALREELAKPEQEPVAWATLNQAAQSIVKEKYLFKRFIDGTPLENDIACWMADFALDYTAPPRTSIEHAVIAGVLFDFMGWLTSRQERLVLSASDEASPAVKVIQEFANMRGLKLEDAQVERWQAIFTTPHSAKGSTDSAETFGKREWVGLTDYEVLDCVHGQFDQRNYWVKIGKAIEAKLKEKNT